MVTSKRHRYRLLFWLGAFTYFGTRRRLCVKVLSDAATKLKGTKYISEDHRRKHAKLTFNLSGLCPFNFAKIFHFFVAQEAVDIFVVFLDAFVSKLKYFSGKTVEKIPVV
jgi:hypothetical protein